MIPLIVTIYFGFLKLIKLILNFTKLKMFYFDYLHLFPMLHL